jgi:hypothetical protein
MVARQEKTMINDDDLRPLTTVDVHELQTLRSTCASGNTRATLEDAHEAARAAVPAGWVLWDFAVSEDCDDECTALVVRG